jgi:hypothetical protein
VTVPGVFLDAPAPLGPVGRRSASPVGQLGLLDQRAHRAEIIVGETVDPGMQYRASILSGHAPTLPTG